MSLTHSTALRNVLAQASNDALTAGSLIRFRDGATTVADIDLSHPAFGSPSTGVITLEDVPLAVNAVGSGDLDNFQILNGAAAVTISGTVTATGGGGDITVNNISVNAGQEMAVNSLTYEAPV